jgi:uncharacterized repeat protein (TIGR01451 family)
MVSMKADILTQQFQAGIPATLGGSMRDTSLRMPRAWSLLSGALVFLLAFMGLQASPALAGPNDLGLSVSNGGVTSVSDYTDAVPLEVQISLPSGTTVKPGAITKLTLDSSLKRSNNGALPAGATAQTWDEKSNTLTVTWGALYAGTVYAASVNATPSAIATTASTLTATAVTTGTSTDDIALEQTATSAAISAGGAIAATLSPVTPGSWTLASSSTLTGYPGTTPQATYPVLNPVGVRTSFRNLQVVTDWTSAAPGDQLMPKSWSAFGAARMNGTGQGLNFTTVQNDANTTIFSYGAWNATHQMPFGVNIPAGTAPGTYSVLYSVQDDADASGVNNVVAYSGVFKVVVKAPEAAVLTFSANKGSTQVVPGGLFDWNHRLQSTAPAGKITDLTVVAPIPAQAVLKGISGGFSGDVAYPIKSVEYTTDSALASASWQPLPRSGNAVNLPDPGVITAVRYVMPDMSTGTVSSWQGVALTLQAKDDLAVGSSLNLGVTEVTYVDPTDVGSVASLAPNVAFSNSVAVVAPPADPSPRIAAGTGANTYSGDDFNKTYANGNGLQFLAHVGSDGLTPTEQPYVFAITPKGVNTTLSGTQTCSTNAWLSLEACRRGVPTSYPQNTFDTGTVKLADGSTLSYARVKSGQIGGGRDGVTEFIAAGGIQVVSALAGKQTVLFGMGSSTQNSFTVSPLNNSVSPAGAAPFAPKSLTDATSFGPYQGVGAEAFAALQAAGISTTNALVGERSFTVSPATSVGSNTTIKGSEDAAGIVQGAGTATTRPGGSVSYKVDVSNTGSTIYNNFQFIDVLPAQGDSYTLNAAAPRGSAFDVNLSGNVQVLVNGVPSAGAVVEYSTSATPQRFNAAGADVAGDAWLPYTGAVNGAKALRVTLAAGVPFAPGDKITLSFDGTVPASAPRDGSTAKNTIAYRFQTGAGAWTAAEAPAVPVKSSAPAGDTQLSGQAFVDLNDNGQQDSGEAGLNGAGVALQLYKMVSGSPVAVGTPVTPNTDSGADGVFSFIGIDPNLTYRVKPVSSNPNVTFPAAALDADGYLKYVRVTDAAANGSVNTSQYVGSSSFLVGDQVGSQKWIKDLRLPLNTKTTVSGTLSLTNTANTPITAGPGSVAAPFVKDYTVKLMEGATQKASTTTNESGAFAFTALAGLTPGDYTLVFVSPSGRQLVGSTLNNSAVFTGAATAGADGVYALNGLQPGTGATGINAYYTESAVPTANAPTYAGGTVVNSAAVNPATAALSGSDVGTAIVSYAWKILASDSSVKASGTALSGSPVVTIPGSLAEGGYTLAVTATDVIGNVSPEVSKAFAKDVTAPAISATASVTYAKGSPATPTSAAGWIALFAVTATDAGLGMAATNPITVDASAVDAAHAGTYRVVFTATDKAGNQSTKNVDYVVGYVADPLITLGQNAATFEMGATAPANDAAWKALFGGVTATTSGGTVLSPVTATVAVDASAVNLAVPGSYSVVFTVTDSLGYTSTVTGALTVQDTTKPVITTSKTSIDFVDGDAQVTTDAGWITAYGAAASDTGGTGVASLVVDASSVNYAIAGNYAVTFTATDIAGNIGTKAVNYVVKFAGAPQITVGNDPVTHEMGDTKPATNADWIALFDAAATTAQGTTLKSLTVDTSQVDFGTPSAAGYNVTFTATDSNDNTAVYVGKLKVQDTTAPTATVKKSTMKHKMLAPATAYTMAEWLAMFDVSATDTAGGSGIDANAWTVTEGVNFGAAGDYTVEFVAHDNAGNTSAKVTATLTIQAPPTSDTVIMNAAQDRTIALDPLARSTSTGSLVALTDADLGVPSAGGTVTLDSEGVLYQPAKGFSGQESVAFTVTDDLGQTAAITYTFTVIKKGAVVKNKLPEYYVPVDGQVTIPLTAVRGAVDVGGLDLDSVVIPPGFVGKVKVDGTNVIFTTDGSSWSGDEVFDVILADELDQTVAVPVDLHVVPPQLVTDLSSGYAGKTKLTIKAAGLVAGKSYKLELHSDPISLGSVTADAAGSAQLVVTLPGEATLGAHELVLLNEKKQARATAEFTVLPVKSEPKGGGTGGNTAGSGLLSLTGSTGFGVLGGVAALLLLLGGILLYRSRNRKLQEKPN